MQRGFFLFSSLRAFAMSTRRHLLQAALAAFGYTPERIAQALR